MKNPIGELPHGKFEEIKQSIYTAGFFFSSSFDVIARHFLSNFIGGDIFKMSFDEIRKAFIPIAWEIESVPETEIAFYEYVCKEYLEIQMLPSIPLIKYYEDAINDISKIETNISNYINNFDAIDKKEPKDKTETDTYKGRLLKHYINLNKAAMEEVLNFLKRKVKNYALFDSLKVPHFLGMFYKGAPYAYRWIPHRFETNYLSDVNNKLLELELGKLREIRGRYSDGDKIAFYDEAKKYIEQRKVIDQIQELTKNNHRLHERREIFEEAFELYNAGKKTVFCAVIPSQIEGLFYDYCLELGIEEGSIRNASLSSKLNLIVDKNPEYSGFEYYSFRFPIIRNKVAHGKQIGENIEDFANYLLLDLYDVCKQVSSSLLPINRAVSIIRGLAKEPKDMKALIRYSIYRNQDIPSFYNFELEILKIKEEIVHEPFWNYLRGLARDGSETLKKGVFKIVTDLKKAEVNTIWCKELLTELIGIKPDGLVENDFFDELNIYEPEVE